MSIGVKIRELAEERNMSLAELAKRIGKTKQAVYEIVEKDDVNTSILRQLCSVFSVPMSYFFDEYCSAHAVASGDNSIAAINSEVYLSKENDFLKERIKYLEQILAEKERLITVLMQTRNV